MDWLFHDIPLLVDQLGVLLVVLCVVLLFAGALGLPLPEDIPLLVIGYLCYRGAASLWVMAPIVFVVVLGGDCLIYYLGRRWGVHVTRIWPLGRFLSPRRLALAGDAFRAHGGKTLFVARFLPGLRSPVFFSAGLFRVPVWKMLAFDGAAALISVPAILLGAYFFGAQLDRVRQWTARAEISVLAILLGAAALFVAWRYLRRRRSGLAPAAALRPVVQPTAPAEAAPEPMR